MLHNVPLRVRVRACVSACVCVSVRAWLVRVSVCDTRGVCDAVVDAGDEEREEYGAAQQPGGGARRLNCSAASTPWPLTKATLLLLSTQSGSSARKSLRARKERTGIGSARKRRGSGTHAPCASMGPLRTPRVPALCAQ